MTRIILGAALACLAADSPKDYDGRTTQESLQGTWLVQSVEYNGRKMPAEEVKGAKMVFAGNRLTFDRPGYSLKATFTIDAARDPAHIDIQALDGPEKGKTMKMIYRLEGNTLKLAGRESDSKDRPKEFRADPGSQTGLLILKRQ
jgi:uncharacterized protein (TIGR03067 family)